MPPSNRLIPVLLCFIAVFAMAETKAPPSNYSQNLFKALLDPFSSKIFIAAHRGGYENDKEDEAPENSIANIHNCKTKGYELFETDLQRTKDGHFVIVHDPTIDRETSGTGKASEMTLEELKLLKKRFRDGSLSSESIATLSEFLEQGKGNTVFKADLKPGVSQHFGEIIKLVTDLDALDQIIFRVPYAEADLFENHRSEGGALAKHSLMFKVTSRKQIDDIKARFNSSLIEIKLSKDSPVAEGKLDLIRYATAEGFTVETHAEGNEAEWKVLVENGVRMFHTSKPARVKQFIENTLPD